MSCIYQELGMDEVTHPIVLNESDDPVVLTQEEFASHDAIDEIIEEYDVKTISQELRIEIEEFLNETDSTKSPETPFEDSDIKSDTSTNSDDSVKFLIATSVKRPQIPEGWNKKLLQMSTPKPSSEESSILPSPDVSYISSTSNKKNFSFQTFVSEDPEEGLKAVVSPYITTHSGEKKAILALFPHQLEAILPKAASGLDQAIQEGNRPRDLQENIITSTPNARYARPNVFPASSSSYQPYRTTILKLTNLPWSTTVDQVLSWLGNGVEKALVPQETQIVSVHILCDRFKGRTKSPAYIELTSVKLAQLIMTKKGMKEMQGRKIKITQASRKTLMSEIFPTWSQLELSNEDGVPIVSNFELEGLLALCKLKAPFAVQIPERPFMNVLSIAAKYPWKARDMLDQETEEQMRVLQTVREAHKLLNQYGKRMSNYEKIRRLFIIFLEGHGGISGSLRPIPVDPAICPLPTPKPSFENFFDGRRFNTSFFRETEIETNGPLPPPASLAGSTSTESGSPPISSGNTSGGSGKILDNCGGGKAQLEAALNAQREYARQDLEAISQVATPETTPERRPPSVLKLTSAPTKKDPIVKFNVADYKTPDRNLVTARTFRESNQAYDRAQRAKKLLEPINEEGVQKGRSNNSTTLGRNTSSMSMESQISGMGKSTASSPLTIEKTHKIESFFTPPKYSLTPAVRRDTSMDRSDAGVEEGRSRDSAYSAEGEQNSMERDSFEQTYGMPKAKIADLLRNLLANS